MKDLTWKTHELEVLVSDLAKTRQAHLIRPPLHSIQWRIFQARYHSDLARDKLKQCFPKESTLVDFFKIIFPDEVSLEAKKLAETNRIEICFNIISAGQAMHAVVDLLAKVIFESFADEPGYSKVDINKRNIFEAYKLVQNSFPELSAEIQKLTSSESFVYLRSYSNVLKHHAFLDINYHADCSKGELGFHIINFEYDDYDKERKFEKKNILEFIESLDSISKQVIVIGNSINKCLARKLETNQQVILGKVDSI